MSSRQPAQTIRPGRTPARDFKMVWSRDTEAERPPLSLILPRLYLGAERDVTQDRLSSLGISYVLSVSRCSPQPSFLPPSGYLRVPIDDSLWDDLLPWIPQALHFIDGAMSSGASVLVHCAAGISRSPALAVAYIMYTLGMDLDRAYRFVKERRPSISPNFNFLGQLQHFQATLSHKACGSDLLAPQPDDRLASIRADLLAPQPDDRLASIRADLLAPQPDDRLASIRADLLAPQPDDRLASIRADLLAPQPDDRLASIRADLLAPQPDDRLASIRADLLAPQPDDRLASIHGGRAHIRNPRGDSEKSCHTEGATRHRHSEEDRKLPTLHLTLNLSQQQVGAPGPREAEPRLPAASASLLEKRKRLSLLLTPVNITPPASGSSRPAARATAQSTAGCPRLQMAGDGSREQSPPHSRRSPTEGKGQGLLSPFSITLNKLLGWGERVLLGGVCVQPALPYRC